MPPPSSSQATNRRITDTALRAAKPSDKSYKISVGDSLYLEVTRTGSKLWRWKYRLGGKENRFAIGSYPTTSLKEAREAMDEARKEVKAGIHPSHKRKSDRIAQGLERSQVFETIAEEWIRNKDWEEVTKERRRGLFRRHVFPSIGKLPVKQITPAHILDILTTIAKTAPTVAAEAKRSMSGVFELAVSTLRATIDPVYPVRKAIKPHKTQHRRPLSGKEIGDLLRAFEGHHGTYQASSAFKLMWLTLCRPTEAVEAEWGEFDLNDALWRISAKRMKMREDHVIPLPRQAVEMLRAVQGITGKYTHVFPNRDDRERPMALATIRQAIYKAGWKGLYSPHATRATGSTRLNEMGFNPDWIETQLAHEDENSVRASYNFARYLSGRTDMMQHWADYLDALIAGNKVVAGKFGKVA